MGGGIQESFSFLNPTVRALYFSLTGERINIAFRRWREHAAASNFETEFHIEAQE